MLHQLKIIFIIQLIITPFLFSQTIESINMIGNKNYSQSDYLEWIKLQPGQTVFDGIKDSIIYRI